MELQTLAQCEPPRATVQLAPVVELPTARYPLIERLGPDSLAVLADAAALDVLGLLRREGYVA